MLAEAGVLAALGAPNRSESGADGVRAALRLQVLVAARAIGVQAVIAPAGDGDDKTAYRTAIEAARGLGYDGARCTHPVQVTLANEVFAAT